MVYLFSQLMTLEVAFLSPYVPCSPCRMLAARSKALRVHARQGRDLGRVFFVCQFAPFGEICPGSAWAHPDSPPAGDTGAALSPRLQCAWIFAPLWGLTAMLWLLG